MVVAENSREECFACVFYGYPRKHPQLLSRQPRQLRRAPRFKTEFTMSGVIQAGGLIWVRCNVNRTS